MIYIIFWKQQFIIIFALKIQKVLCIAFSIFFREVLLLFFLSSSFHIPLQIKQILLYFLTNYSSTLDTPSSFLMYVTALFQDFNFQLLINVKYFLQLQMLIKRLNFYVMFSLSIDRQYQIFYPFRSFFSSAILKFAIVSKKQCSSQLEKALKILPLYYIVNSLFRS